MTLTEYILTIKGLHKGTGHGNEHNIKCMIDSIYIIPMKHYSCDGNDALCERILMNINAAITIFGEWNIAGIDVNNDGCFAAPILYVYKGESK